MRIVLIGIFVAVTSCNAQNNKKLESEIASFFKISNKDIQNCQKESERLRDKKKEEWLIANIYDQCIAQYEHYNFYKDNTLKMLEKTSGERNFLIINYISDNTHIPYSTKTILKINNDYYGLKHYFEDENNQFVDKNEEFTLSNSELENIQQIDEYLKTGSSEYISDKSAGLSGKNIHWYIVAKNNGELKMIELFRIK